MGGKNTTVTTPAPPTARDIAFQDKQLEAVNLQIEQLRKQSDFQQSQFDRFSPEIEAQFAEAKIARERQVELDKVLDKLLKKQVADIEQGTKATPDQLASIDASIRSATETGESDILRFQDQAVGRLSSELAPSLGLRPSDTPVVDRGGEIAEESVRQQGQLVSGLAGTRATAELNFPLAAGELQSNRLQFLQSLGESQRQFNERLSQQGFTNRLALGANVGGQGLSLAGLNAGFPNFPRGSTQTTKKGLGFMDIAGPLATVAAAGIPAGAFSHSSLKNVGDKIDGHKVLDAIKSLDISRWAYKGDSVEHIGPMAEDFQASFDVGDGVTINLLDAIGVLFAAVKAQAEAV